MKGLKLEYPQIFGRVSETVKNQILSMQMQPHYHKDAASFYHTLNQSNKNSINSILNVWLGSDHASIF